MNLMRKPLGGRQLYEGGEQLVSRRNRTHEVLKCFKDIAERNGLPLHVGQTKENRIALKNGGQLEYGDLRVSMAGKEIIVEVETAGGLTNLMKYMYCLKHGDIDGPIFLLHLYSQNSSGDHKAHVTMWKFFRTLIRAELKDRFDARLFRFDYGAPGTGDELGRARREFEFLIENGAFRSSEDDSS
jgi:hypothetical protein